MQFAKYSVWLLVIGAVVVAAGLVVVAAGLLVELLFAAAFVSRSPLVVPSVPNAHNPIPDLRASFANFTKNSLYLTSGGKVDGSANPLMTR